jgi:hypothetical protein
MRKRDKALGPGNADVPNIDMDTLRASTRANDIIDKNISRTSKQSTSQSQSADESTSPTEHAKQLPPHPPPPLQQQQHHHHHHHQGSFQLVPVMTTNGPPPNSDIGNRVHGQQGQSVITSQNTGSMSVPPPPWATSASPGGRGYAPDQIQHQSFMRTSHHPTPNGTSPR